MCVCVCGGGGRGGSGVGGGERAGERRKREEEEEEQEVRRRRHLEGGVVERDNRSEKETTEKLTRVGEQPQDCVSQKVERV